jgi:hypothetical protein
MLFSSPGTCRTSARAPLIALIVAALAHFAVALSAQTTWEMPAVRGNVSDGWAPGTNWTANPFPDAGGSWSAFHQTGNHLKPMVAGRAYGFHFAWREPGEGFAPRTMLTGRKLQAAPPSPSEKTGPASGVAFTPPHRGPFQFSIEGRLQPSDAKPSQSLVQIGVFDPSLTLRRELLRQELTQGAAFSWHDKVHLEQDESLGFQISSLITSGAAAHPPIFNFDHFKVTDLGHSRFSATVPANVEAWNPRDPEVQIQRHQEGGMTLQIPPGQKQWYVLDGPSISLPQRTRFNTDRTLTVNADVWPLKASATPIPGYAMHLRASLNGGSLKINSTSPGSRHLQSPYAQNVSARQFWNTVWELADAHRMTSWTTVSGTAKIPPSCHQLSFELWLAVPRDTPSTLHLRDFLIRESFSESHLLSSFPAQLGNIFFSEQGAMLIDFARAKEVSSWTVTDRDESGQVQQQLTGTGAPEAVHFPLQKLGIHRIEATASYQDGSNLASQTSAAVVGEPLADTVRLHSRFGLARVHGDMDLWKKSGARWEWGIGKIQLRDWILDADGSIHPPAHWHSLQKSSGFTDLLSVGSLPPWLYGPDNPPGWEEHYLAPPKDWQLYERLFEAFARANPDLPLFSTYNEANAKWRGTPEQLILFHTLMAKGARRANPRMEVSGPVDFSINLETFRRSIQRGMFGQDGLQAVNMHAYIGATPPEDEFIERIQGMARLLKQAGLSELPVYITEFGWARGSDRRFEPIPDARDHPRYIARSLALLAAQPVDAVIWHCFQISGSPKPEDELGYNLLNADHTPSASYVAFVNSVKWLSEIKRGDARWFRLSPHLHLVLGRTETKTMGVAWSTERELAFELPGQPLRVTDMMGRPLPNEARLRLSPSPLFFELPPQHPWLDLPERPPITAYPGQSFQTEQAHMAAPDGIRTNGQLASVSNNATPGHYLLFAKGSDPALQALQPVIVPPPLVLHSLSSVLSGDAQSLEIVAKVIPATSGSLKTSLQLGSKVSSAAEFPMVAGQECSIRLPVPSYQPGKRVQGEVRIETLGLSPFTVGGPIDITALPVPILTQRPNWDQISTTDFSSWSSAPRNPPQEGSSFLQTAASPDGLHIRLTVQDEIHRQTQPPESFHQEDSVQLAFDPDGDQPWQFNLIMDGSYNGHRILGYDVAKPSADAPPVVWRSRADCPGFTSQSLAPEVAATVDHKSGWTIYDLTFPWSALGLKSAPDVGKQLGFSLAVHDVDQGPTRKTTRFGDGILGSQDPKRFATLKIVGNPTNATPDNEKKGEAPTAKQPPKPRQPSPSSPPSPTIETPPSSVR